MSSDPQAPGRHVREDIDAKSPLDSCLGVCIRAPNTPLVVAPSSHHLVTDCQVRRGHWYSVSLSQSLATSHPQKATPSSVSQQVPCTLGLSWGSLRVLGQGPAARAALDWKDCFLLGTPQCQGRDGALRDLSCCSKTTILFLPIKPLLRGGG